MKNSFVPQDCKIEIEYETYDRTVRNVYFRMILNSQRTVQ